MPPPLILDPASIDLTRTLMDREAIHRLNPQRFEMEQLTAVVLLDTDQHLIVAYKDVGDDEFWIRGHMPGFPLMPGVVMCEAAAQMCAVYIRATGIMGGDFVAFGGMDNVRFRGIVRPGDRFLLVGKMTKTNRRQTTSQVQGFVGNTMVFQAEIIGVPFTLSGAASGAEGS